jgi:hypothetical protein
MFVVAEDQTAVADKNLFGAVVPVPAVFVKKKTRKKKKTRYEI